MKDKYLLNERELELMEKVRKITKTDYDIQDGIIEDYNLINAISDLLYEVEYLNEHIDFYYAKQREDYNDFDFECWERD